MRRSIVLCLALLLSASVFAQHGEIELKPFTSLPAGSLQDGIGHCDLKVTTKSEEARKFFEQGMCYYHAFHWTEAQRSFRDAVKADPGFAMGWWGIHIVLQNPWNRSNTYKAERDGAIERAVRMMDGCSPLEQDLIRAFKIWSVNPGSAFADFEKTMMEICRQYPKEVEPRIILAGIYCQTDLSTMYAEPVPDSPMGKARMLVQEALKLDPKSAGAHHYWIHSNEGGPRPEDALASADALGKIAFNSGHLIHMPGHIYFRCGLYDKAVESLGNGMKADEAYNKAVGTSNGNWNYFHNIDFLLSALAEAGKKSEALALARGKSRGKVAYLLWRDSDFETLAKELESKSVKVGPLMEAFVGVNTAFQHKELDELEQAVKKVTELTGTSDKFDRDQFYRIEAQTALACAKNDGEGVEPLVEEVIRILGKQPYDEPPDYGRPVCEGMGLMLLNTTKLDLAKRCFDLALKDRPNNPYSLYGLAMVAEKKGNKGEAKKLFVKTIEALKAGDKDLAIYKESEKRANAR